MDSLEAREKSSGSPQEDAFNLTANWWDSEVLGIDQGPILIMIENYRTGHVWETFMKAQEIQRGLRNAGFRNIAP